MSTAASRALLARHAVRRCAGVRPLLDEAGDPSASEAGGLLRGGMRRGDVDATASGPDGATAVGAAAAGSPVHAAVACHAGTGGAPRQAGVGTGGGSGGGG